MLTLLRQIDLQIDYVLTVSHQTIPTPVASKKGSDFATVVASQM